MEDCIEIRTYNVRMLKDWLFSNEPQNGLGAQVIEKTRAFSIVSNPYAEDDMDVVCALFVGDELAAFTAVMPDWMENPRECVFFWFTTLYVVPKYQGLGYGYCVLASMNELHPGLVFDIDALDETNASLSYLGCDIEYFTQYHVYLRKDIRRTGLKSRLAYAKEYALYHTRAFRKAKILRSISDTEYNLEYVRFVDNELINFIRNNSNGDAFVRSKEMFNWILSFPFMLSAPLKERCINGNEFSSNRLRFEFIGVKVFAGERLVGFYIMRICENELSLKYLYYNPEFEAIVYESIIEHIITSGLTIVTTNSEKLNEAILSERIHSKYVTEKKSFAHPKWFDFDPNNNTIQAGDGDMIT